MLTSAAATTATTAAVLHKHTEILPANSPCLLHPNLMLLYLWHAVLLIWLAPCHSEITIISELSDPQLCLEQYPTLPMGVTPLTSWWSSHYIYVSQ